MSSCGPNIALSDLAEEIKKLLNLDSFVKTDSGVANNITLKGDITMDTAAKAAMCANMAQCIADAIDDVTKGNVIGNLSWDATRAELSWTENGKSKTAQFGFVKGTSGSDGSTVLTLPNGVVTVIPNVEHILTKEALRLSQVEQDNEWLKSQQAQDEKFAAEQKAQDDKFAAAEKALDARIKELECAKCDCTDGKSAYQIWLDQGNTGTEADFLESLKGPAGSNGQDGELDCAAIAALPNAVWKEGTAILATQDGQCKKIVPNSAFFQEIGVGITASVLKGTTDDIYSVVVTVSNTGEETNEQTDLVITKPQLGNYRIENFDKRSQGAKSIEATDDSKLNYTIRGLQRGGTAVVTFDVIASSAGTYQFTAAVNPNSILDMQKSNNTSSLILSVSLPTKQKEDITYIPTVTCPAIQVFDVATGNELYMGFPEVGITHFLEDGTVKRRLAFLAGRLNLVTRGDNNLNGLKLRFTDTSYIYVYDGNQLSTTFWGDSNRLYDGGLLPYGPGQTDSVEHSLTLAVPNHNNMVDLSTSFTYNENTGIFEYTGSEGAIHIFAKPKDTACRWQHLVVYSTLDKSLEEKEICSFLVTPRSSNVKTVDEVKEIAFGKLAEYLSLAKDVEYVAIGEGAKQVEFKNNVGGVQKSFVFFSPGGVPRQFLNSNKSWGGTATVTTTTSVSIKKGTRAAMTVKSCTPYIAKADGNVKYTKNGAGTFEVIIEAAAEPRDSFQIDNIPFNIID